MIIVYIEEEINLQKYIGDIITNSLFFILEKFSNKRKIVRICLVQMIY